MKNQSYITRMSGFLDTIGYSSQRVLKVVVYIDAKQFNAIKKKSDPLAIAMPQIKNVVWDSCGVDGLPSYTPQSYSQRYPRASKGMVKVTLIFDLTEYKYQALKDLRGLSIQEVFEQTKHDGHLFAKPQLRHALQTKETKK